MAKTSKKQKAKSPSQSKESKKNSVNSNWTGDQLEAFSIELVRRVQKL